MLLEDEMLGEGVLIKWNKWLLKTAQHGIEKRLGMICDILYVSNYQHYTTFQGDTIHLQGFSQLRFIYV